MRDQVFVFFFFILMLVYFKTNTDYRKYKLWTICVVMVAGKFYFAVEKNIWNFNVW